MNTFDKECNLHLREELYMVHSGYMLTCQIICES
jgi:hypothetical protein